MTKLKCYECTNRRILPWSAHSRCVATEAIVGRNLHGIKNGWFYWPYNFDPVWLISCNSFSPKATP